MTRKHFQTTDEYISTFPQNVQVVLKELRKTIKKTAPKATESISYNIPTFKINGKYLIYFAGFKNHISIYPIFSEDEKTLKELSKYRSGKGTAKFPLSEPLPLPLIEKIVRFKIKKMNISSRLREKSN